METERDVNAHWKLFKMYSFLKVYFILPIKPYAVLIKQLLRKCFEFYDLFILEAAAVQNGLTTI